MARFRRANYPIAEFLQWYKKGQLILQPKFQRRAVWSEDARSYLIDTVVRGLPMPKVYLRRTVNPETSQMVYEVVDGQQRLKAILDFYQGTLVLSKRHNPELGGVTFQALPDPVQNTFREYDVSTEVMEDASDSEVWAMFERLNTYTLTLNRQEKLNARWFGEFKQTAYKLAAEESALEAWRELRVFTNIQIARMKEVEFTSDVMVAMVRGISDITAIAKAYQDFDAEFPKREVVKATFGRALRYMTGELGGAVAASRFHNRAWLYSLMVAAADALIGIPQGFGPAELRPGGEIQRRMFDLDHALRLLETPAGEIDQNERPIPVRLNDLREALSRGTSHLPPRKTRHEYFFAMLTLAKGDWSEKWRKLTGRE
jgi:hypothetical protein